MARIKTKTIAQTVARDIKTGRYVPIALAKKQPKRIAVQAVRIPTRTLFGYGQTV